MVDSVTMRNSRSEKKPKSDRDHGRILCDPDRARIVVVIRDTGSHGHRADPCVVVCCKEKANTRNLVYITHFTCSCVVVCIMNRHTGRDCGAWLRWSTWRIDLVLVAALRLISTWRVITMRSLTGSGSKSNNSRPFPFRLAVRCADASLPSKVLCDPPDPFALPRWRQMRNQNKNLDDMNDTFSNTNGLLGNTMKRLGLLSKGGGNCTMGYLALFVFSVLLLMWRLTKK